MPQSPRVVVVTSRLDVGGTERHLTRVLPGLRQRGIDITLYVMERGGALERELSAQDVRIEGPRRMRVLHWPRATLHLARFLRRERLDIVHFFLPRPYVIGSIAAELAGHRRRIMSRRSLTDYQSAYPLLGRVERLLHRRTLGLIGNSWAVVDQLRRETGDPCKVALIHNGVALPDSRSANGRRRTRSSLQIPDDAFVVAIVANLVAYKGHRDLLEALARVKEDLPKPWRMLAIGRDDGVGFALKEQAAASHLAANILWLGERSDVGDLLAASDAFVLPSHQEGFSNALLEAMAAGLPVIATAIGGNVDAVTDDETGLLVPPKNPEALAFAMLRLTRDSDLCRRLGDAARLSVERRFSLDAGIERYAQMYRALNEPSPRPIGEILRAGCATARPGEASATMEHAD